MLELDQKVLDVAGHAESTALTNVIPFDGDAGKFISGHVELYPMVLLKKVKEEVEVFDVVIRNANVINILSGEINKQTLYIKNGRIKKITSQNHLKFTSEFIIDAAGKYVLPGFWDNHVHFRGGDSLIQANKETLQLFLMNGVTTVRDAGGDLTRNVMDWKNQIRQKTLVGPTIFSSGPKVDGQNSRWEGSLVVSHNDEINTVLDSLQKLRVDFVKLYV